MLVCDQSWLQFLSSDIDVRNVAFELSLAEGLHFERRLFQSLFATSDQKEGILSVSLI